MKEIMTERFYIAVGFHGYGVFLIWLLKFSDIRALTENPYLINLVGSIVVFVLVTCFGLLLPRKNKID